jgi:hypothetical protein
VTPEQQQRQRSAEILLRIGPTYDYAALRRASIDALRAEFGWSEEEAEGHLDQMCASAIQSELTPMGGPLAQDGEVPQATFRWQLI